MTNDALPQWIATAQFADFTGEVTAIGQRSFRANGPYCKVGDICEAGPANERALAEVVAVSQGCVDLVPLRRTTHLQVGETIFLSHRLSGLSSGDGFASRAVDAFGMPIDGGTPVVQSAAQTPQSSTSMAKTIVPNRVETGVRAIDTLLPLAQGQRIGVFAASGVGKTTLVEQLFSRVSCDKVVLCLIGERGREVERLWDQQNRSKGSAAVTLVAATSDESPSVRIRAMRQALAICEHWRNRGEHVVLFVDSVTRLALALRDIGLAAGEPPTLRSYTPNVLTALPEFVERCGAISGKGAITAIFTVLSETDDVDDPIAETMRSLLDGHIVLSRKLAERGHYPAIDVRASISRVADQILDASAREAARKLKSAVAVYEEARAMIESGLYQPGASASIDEAIALWPRIQSFLIQSNGAATLDESDHALRNCLSDGGEP